MCLITDTILRPKPAAKLVWCRPSPVARKEVRLWMCSPVVGANTCGNIRRKEPESFRETVDKMEKVYLADSYAPNSLIIRIATKIFLKLCIC